MHMKNKLSTQYNSISEEYFKGFHEMNEPSIRDFKKHLDTILESRSRTIVDLGCGPGEMILHLQSFGHQCFGVDSSDKMVVEAKEYTGADIRAEDFSSTSFTDASFDIAISKWAMQTAEEIDPIYREVVRILRSGGHFVFLVVHPLRQFLEKKKNGKDYFKKEIVHSEIFDRTIIVQEPSHTLMEYLSPYFLSNFSVLAIKEGAEFPAAEQLGGDTYPTYLLVVAQKK